MIKNEKTRMITNRIVSFLVGGLLVYAVISMTVVSNVKNQNAKLTKELDISVNEPARLLADAKAQIANRDFAKAKLTLTDLLEKRPGSTEATEAKALYTEASAAVVTENENWDAAVVAIRALWAKDMTAQLRAKSEKARLEMENGLSDTLAKEWDKVKEDARVEWSKQQG